MKQQILTFVFVYTCPHTTAQKHTHLCKKKVVSKCYT